MNVVNDTPYRFAPFMGKVIFPKDTLTVIVKGTFRLHPGGKAEPVDPDQQIPPTGDLHHDDDPHASCRYESDFVHFKPRADLLLAGHCYAPGGEPVPAGSVRFHVGGMQKALMVFGDRHWRRTRVGTRAMSDPELFTRMALRYENSFGGPDYSNNPVGKGIHAKPDENGRSHHKLANLKVLEGEKLKTMMRGTPAGFGPLGKTWAQRQSLAGSYGDQWKKERWPWLPEDFNWRYCNAAPPDQQVKDYLKGDEPLYFENMHPEHAAYPGALPGTRVRCFLSEHHDGQNRFREISTCLDTLWADMDNETLILVWRGLATVDTPVCDEVEDLFIVQEPVGKTPGSLEHYEQLLRQRKAEAVVLEEETEPEAVDAQDTEAFDEDEGSAEDADLDAALGKAMTQAHAALDQSGLDAGRISELKREKDPETFVRKIMKAFDLDPLAGEKLKAHVREKHAASIDQYRPELEKILKKNGIDPALLDEADAFSMEDEEEDAASPGKNMTDRGDISGTDFSGRSLEGTDFKEGQLDGTDFSDARLSGADFSEASLINVDFTGADLTGANFANADLSHARLDHARLQGADLSGAVLVKAMLKKADLTGAVLLQAQLEQADLSQAELEKADLQQADFTGADLTHALLRHADLDFAVLDGAVLTRADLRQVKAGNASFQGAILLEADFTDADLEESNFSFCRCDNAVFDQAVLNRATFEGASGHQVSFRGAELAQMRAGENACLPGSVFRRAVGARGNWAGADLRGADFILAEMPYCDFSRADLSGSDGRTADLKEGVFDNACLNNVMFNRANLFQSRMENADLTGTNFKGANLYGSEFLKAAIDKKTNFDMANLKRTKLAAFKA